VDYNKATKIFGFKTFVNNEKSFIKLKKKYRKLAKKCHPDMPGGSAEKFKDLHSAYLYLLDVQVKIKPPTTESRAFTFAAFTGFLTAYENHIIAFDQLVEVFGLGHKATLIEWLNMSKDLGYIDQSDRGICINYSPPQLTIERFYFMHQVRFSGGFKGNDDYAEAESRYKAWWSSKF
jgi:curved DNA-binding protein CbpA